MEFDVFKDDICELVSKQMGPDYDVSTRNVTKNNGVILTGIMAKKQGSNIFPTLYINNMYSDDLSKEDMHRIALKISDNLINASVPPTDMLDELFEYERIREKIAFKLINTRRNAELLKVVPHRDFLNLSVVYYIDLEDAKNSAGCRATLLIRDRFMEQWKISEEALFDQALSNMKDHSPDKIVTMKEILEERFDHMMDIDIGMYVLSNKNNMYGASTMLYGSGIKQLSKDLDRNLYILPSSVHELIILPQDDNTNAEALLEIVSQINDSEVSDEEILADSVYLYDRDSDSVRVLLEKDEN